MRAIERLSLNSQERNGSLCPVGVYPQNYYNANAITRMCVSYKVSYKSTSRDCVMPCRMSYPRTVPRRPRPSRERSRESGGFVTSGLPQLSKRSPIVMTQRLRAAYNFCLFDNDKYYHILQFYR